MSEGAKKLRQAIFGDVTFVPIHLKDSNIAQSMTDIVNFEVEDRIDAAVAPLSVASEPLMSRLRYREARWNDALEPEEQGAPLPDELTIEVTVKELSDLRKALEQWRT